jgi:hypothetical protein
MPIFFLITFDAMPPPQQGLLTSRSMYLQTLGAGAALQVPTRTSTNKSIGPYTKPHLHELATGASFLYITTRYDHMPIQKALHDLGLWVFCYESTSTLPIHELRMKCLVSASSIPLTFDEVTSSYDFGSNSHMLRDFSVHDVGRLLTSLLLIPETFSPTKEIDGQICL